MKLYHEGFNDGVCYLISTMKELAKEENPEERISQFMLSVEEGYLQKETPTQPIFEAMGLGAVKIPSVKKVTT